MKKNTSILNESHFSIILGMVEDGKTDVEIGRALGCSRSTVVGFRCKNGIIRDHFKYFDVSRAMVSSKAPLHINRSKEREIMNGVRFENVERITM